MRKIAGLVANPKKIIIWSNYLLNHKRVERIERAGKVFFKYKGVEFPFLYLPHIANKMWEPGGPWGGPGHVWSPTYETVNNFLKESGVEIIDFNPDKDEYWSFYIIGRKM